MRLLFQCNSKKVHGHFRCYVVRMLAIVSLLITVALIFGSLGYSITRHMIRDSLAVFTDGQSVDVAWKTDKVPAARLGFVADNPITNAKVNDKGNSSSRTAVGTWGALFAKGNNRTEVMFRPGPYVHVNQLLASRQIHNIYGSRVLRWQCTLEGAISEDGTQYCFSLHPLGGGDAGYTVVFKGEYCPADRIFTLNVKERLWSPGAESCSLRYQVNHDGTLRYLGLTSPS